ncbi:MAG: hypothetical protein LBH87_02785 [Coriobacteriales bacterium]|jgi:uncharacterized membrane protein|nr:hypothetical protein [Coriobacteriales bacterium]
MNASEYLARLEGLLSGLPDAERHYAIAYFTEYLMDAGPEGEQGAISALGVPEALAAQIKADLAMRELEAEPTGTAQMPQSSNPAATAVGAAFAGAHATGTSTGSSVPNAIPEPAAAAKKRSTLGTVAVVILAIFALPIGVPLAITILALVIALIAVVGSLCIAAVAVVLSLGVTAVATFVSGIALLATSWPIGLFYIGAGLVVFGLTLLVGLGLFYLIRLTLKGMARLFNAIRKRLSRRKDTHHV